ncbi:FG-GAP-like repeat-containing protein [Anaerolineales bacterium HSG24]|nr:FG-GAP-like repeat-containing protein [Anaerolineales bacterium HSG24]
MMYRKLSYWFVITSISLVIMGLGLAQAQGGGIFVDTGQEFSDPQESLDVGLADFDGDGDLDAFIVNGNNQPNQIWFSQGNGLYSAGSQAPGESTSQAIAVGDIDGDKDIDAFVANDGPNYIWFNAGDGNFTSGVGLGDSNSQGVALGDLNGDALTDTIVANNGPNAIWLNDGGVFSTTVPMLGTGNSQDVAVADFNGDGALDLFVANNGPNTVWLNKGDGTFTDTLQSLGNLNSRAVSVGDVDGKNGPDVLVANRGDNNMIWFNDGTGYFTRDAQGTADQQNLGVGFNEDAVLSDLDGDGDLDAFVVAEAISNQVWMNDGAGSFSNSGQSLGSGASYGVAIGDINGDGMPDAFVANKDESHTVWLNFGKLDVVRIRMTPAPVSDQAERNNPIIVPYADTENISNDGNLTVHGHHSGQFSGSSSIGPRSITYTAASNFKAGELIQISTFTDSTNANAYVWQFWGKTDGGVGKFGAGMETADSTAKHNDVVIGDLDGDSSLDAFVVLDGGNRIWKNSGSGSMSPFGTAMGSSNSNAVALGDFDGDGYLDAVVANGRNDDTSQPNQVWMNDGSGNFSNSGQSLGEANSQAVAVGDLDGDGDLDIFVGNGWNPTTIAPPIGHQNVVWINNGSGGFTIGQTMNDYTSASAVALGDFDEDGDLDAFVTNDNQLINDNDRLDQLWLNDGQGQFSKSSQVFWESHGSNSTSAVLGDINNDGYLDIVIGNEGGVNQIWLNNGPQGSYGLGQRVIDSADFKFIPNQSVIWPYSNKTHDVGLGDFNNDGCLDLVLVANGPDSFGLIFANQCEQQLIPTADYGNYAANPIFKNLLTHLAPPSQMQAVQIGDMDGDGDMDVFIATADSGSYKSDRVWINQDDIKVIRTDPPQNGRTIADINQVEVEFSRGIDSSSVNTTTFSVWGQQTGYFDADSYQVPAHLTSTMRLIKSDSPKFKPGELIFGGVQKIMADDGVELPTPHMWQFWGQAIGGSGVFAELQSIANTNNSQDIALANIDDDPNDRIDAFVANRDGPNLFYQHTGGNPDIFLTSSPTTLPGDTQSNGVALADFNRDGFMDALVANTGENELVTDVGSQSTGVKSTNPITTSFDSRDVAVGDFGSLIVNDQGELVLAAVDGYLDAVFVNYGADNYVWLNNKAGGFISSTLSSANQNSQGVVVGDVSNDGRLDIIIANDGNNEVWLNDGVGGFNYSERREHTPGEGSNSTDLALADFNGNGSLDLVVVNADGLDYVWFNDGLGNFQEKNRETLPGSDQVVSNGVEVIDVDGDDDFDIFVAAKGANKVWLNEPVDPKGPFIMGEPLQGTVNTADSQAIAVGDVDGDGDVDAFIVNNGSTSRVWANIPWPKFIISKVVEPATVVQPSDKLTYTITITNGGDLVANDVVITDLIPTGAIYGKAIEQWDVGALNINATTSVSFPVTVGLATDNIVNDEYRVTSQEITVGRVGNKVESEVQIPIEEIKIIGPITGFMGVDYHFTVQVSPTYATTPFVYRWQSNGTQSGPTEIFSQSLTSNLGTISWNGKDKLGRQPITVTVQNPQNEREAVHFITLTTNAVELVRIEGPTELAVGQAYSFTGKAGPPEATTPITYTWQADGQDVSTPAWVNAFTHTIPYTWDSPGQKTIILSATNFGDVVTATHVVTVQIPPQQVVITGPITGPINIGHVFTATSSPITTSVPLTYIWQASNQTITEVYRSDLRHTIPLTWDEAGPQVITVTAINAGGSAMTTHTITTNLFGICQPITGVMLSRYPTNQLTTDTKIQFKVDITEGDPFSYTWTLDGVLQDEQRGTWEHQFPTAMSYVVGVTVTNDCTPLDHYLTETVVITDVIDKADLSQSYKMVSFTDFDVGDRLTYTIFIRNISNIPAFGTTLTDPIPADVLYVSETAMVNGQALTNISATGPIVWSGDVYSGTPVVISFAVEVLTTTNPITNIATLTYSGTDMLLQQVSNYNPGFTLSINEGALYTNIPTVTLRYSWTEPSVGRMSEAHLSNDGGFAGTGDIVIRQITPDTTNPNIEAEWILTTYGEYVIPRTVYVRFRDSLGKYSYPVQDDIIYDPIPPEATNITINGLTARSAEMRQTQLVTIGLTASDDNSGVALVELSNDGQNYSPISSESGTFQTAWQLQGGATVSNTGGDLFVRVYDRAGNVTVVETGAVPPELVSISGTLTPTIVAGSRHITLTASVLPLTTTMPITYIWQATDRTENVVSSNELTQTSVLSWPLNSGGWKTITVTVMNVAGTVSSTIEVYLPGGIYLPVLLRQQ